MRRSRCRMLATLFLLVSICGMSQAANRSFSGMVGKDALFFVEADIGALSEIGDQHAVTKFLKHPAVKDLLGEAFEMDEENDLDLKKEYGIEKEEITKLFPGCVATALLGLEMKNVVSLSSLLSEGDGTFPFDLEYAIFADFTGTWEKLKSIVRTTVKLLNEKHRKASASDASDGDQAVDSWHAAEIVSIESRFDDIPVMLLEAKGKDGERTLLGQLALVDNVAVLVSGEECFRQSIERIKSGNTEDSLLRNSAYSEITQRFGRGGLDAYIRVDHMLTSIIETLGESFEKTPDEDKGKLNVLDGMEITKERLIDALKPESIKALFFSASNTDVGAELRYGALLAGYKGLAGLIQFDDQGAPIPDFVTDEYNRVSISTWSLDRVYKQFHTIMEDLSPALAMKWDASFTSSLQGFDSLKNATLKDIVEPWLAGLTKINADRHARKMHVSQFYVLKLRDADAVESVIERLASALENMLLKKEFMNETLYSLDCDATGLSIIQPVLKGKILSLTIVDDIYLVLGMNGLNLDDLRNLVSAIQNGKGRNLQEIRVVSDVLSELPVEDKVGFSFTRLKDAMQSAAIKKVMHPPSNTGSAKPSEPAPSQPGTEEEIPDFSDIDLVLVGASYRTPKYFVTVLKLREERE